MFDFEVILQRNFYIRWEYTVSMQRKHLQQIQLLVCRHMFFRFPATVAIRSHSSLMQFQFTQKLTKNCFTLIDSTAFGVYHFCFFNFFCLNFFLYAFRAALTQWRTKWQKHIGSVKTLCDSVRSVSKLTIEKCWILLQSSEHPYSQQQINFDVSDDFFSWSILFIYIFLGFL